MASKRRPLVGFTSTDQTLVARMEKREIRETLASTNSNPGFRYALSGLRLLTRLRSEIVSGKTCIAVASLIAFFLPIVIYCSKFGFVITADHDRWAQFGSALSGIYSPILGILTLIVLIKQLELQTVITRHQLDQDVTGPAKSDITDALDAIITATEVDGIPGQSRGQLLLKHFATASREDLLRDDLHQMATAVLFGSPSLFSLWLQVSATLIALKSDRSTTFQSAFASCNLKVTAKLGHLLCVGIENAYFAFLKGHLPHGSVFFSPVLHNPTWQPGSSTAKPKTIPQ